MKNSQRTLLYIVAVAVVLVLCVLIVSYVKNLAERPQPEEDGVISRQAELDALYASEAIPAAPEGADQFNYGLDSEETATVEEISGHLVFSSTPDGTKQPTHIYTLDLSTTSPQAKMLLPGRFPIEGFAEFTDIESLSDFFLHTVHEEPSATSTDRDGTRIQRYDIETGTLQSYKSMIGQYEQNIAWSPSNEFVAYMRLGAPFSGYVDLVPIQNWQVVISDTKQDEIVRVIPGATQPRWSPDGTKLLTLKSNGLYVYDTISEIELRVVGVEEGQILATSMFDVSPDGKYLIWTIAGADTSGVVIVNEIVSWEPFTITEVGRVSMPETEYLWPQFSPDSAFYVVQAIDAPKEGSVTRENPRFEIRSTLNREVLRSIPMIGFDFNAFFTDTWVREVPQIPSPTAIAE